MWDNRNLFLMKIAANVFSMERNTKFNAVRKLQISEKLCEKSIVPVILGWPTLDRHFLFSSIHFADSFQQKKNNLSKIILKRLFHVLYIFHWKSPKDQHVVKSKRINSNTLFIRIFFRLTYIDNFYHEKPNGKTIETGLYIFFFLFLFYFIGNSADKHLCPSKNIKF